MPPPPHDCRIVADAQDFERRLLLRCAFREFAIRYDELSCFHLLNNFDIPIGIEHPEGECPDIQSATQWTSAIDLTNRRAYFKTAYNNTIRCIDLARIDFGKTAYQSHPLDPKREQLVERIAIPE